MACSGDAFSYCSWGSQGKNTKVACHSLLQESEKVGLKLYIQKTKIMASVPVTSWQIDGETVETVTDRLCIFGLQNHCRW